MDNERNIADSTSDSPAYGDYKQLSRHDQNEAPAVDSTNPYYQPSSGADKLKAETKKTQQHAEDILTKTRKLMKNQWESTRQSVGHLYKKLGVMAPKQATDLIYWHKPIQSAIAFGVSLAVIVTFMFLSSLAAISFWLLAFLIIVGLLKLYNYIMATFVGRIQDDLFESMFPVDMQISERQAQELANSIRVNGTALLKQARKLFLWNNLANSVLFGLILFVGFYIGLSMNALTLALITLILLFTLPKIYQVYQVPIDRTAKQVLDQINQLLAKITSKLPNKPKKA